MAEALQPTQAGDQAASLPPLKPEELAPHFPQLEILQCLGRGGMGVVYKARQKSLNRLVALKLLAPERASDAAFAERFAQEAHALAALNHPNIVAVYDFGQAGGFFFLLMEFVDGVNLRQAMKAGRFTPEQALAIVPPVCEALQYAHEHGIVHRDIKPENLLLDKDGRVKIADFGIAKMLGTDSRLGFTESQPVGTPQYMAPEQKDHRRTDHRADIYSLGVVLYEMLTGELPADRLQPPSRKVQLDVRLDEVVLRALEKAPELRYQTAGEMRTQVETIAYRPPAPPLGPQMGRPVPPLSTAANPWPGRILALIAICAGLVVLGFAVPIVLWWGARASPPDRAARAESPLRFTDIASATFGPVTERVLPFDRYCIDFQTGSVVAAPDNTLLGSEDAMRRGLDAMVEGKSPLADPTRTDLPRLVGVFGGGCAFVHDDSSDFDSAKPADAEAQLKKVEAGDLRWGTAYGSGAWWFRSLDGAMGVLEILGASESPRGLKIRYKLLQRSNESLHKNAAVLRAPSELKHSGISIGALIVQVLVIGGVMVCLVAGVIIIVRKSSSGAGKVVAIGCGTMALFLLGLIVLAVSYTWMAVARPAAARQQAEAALQAARAAQARPTPTVSLQVTHESGSVVAVHGQQGALYVCYYAGHYESFSGLRHTDDGIEEGRIQVANGPHFDLRRALTRPNNLKINGREFELPQGRVFVLHEDGTAEQLPIKEELELRFAGDPVAMVRIIAQQRGSDRSARPSPASPPPAKTEP